MAPWRPAKPSTRQPGRARSRATSSPVRLEIMPPLVNAPSAQWKPTNSATQSTAWASTRSAARAVTARLTS